MGALPELLSSAPGLLEHPKAKQPETIKHEASSLSDFGFILLLHQPAAHAQRDYFTLSDHAVTAATFFHPRNAGDRSPRSQCELGATCEFSQTTQ
jgi:hypothetical protein